MYSENMILNSKNSWLIELQVSHYYGHYLLHVSFSSGTFLEAIVSRKLVPYAIIHHLKFCTVSALMNLGMRTLSCFSEHCIRN